MGGLQLRLAGANIPAAIDILLKEASADQWSAPLVRAIIAKIDALVEAALRAISERTKKIDALKEKLKTATDSEVSSITAEIEVLELEVSDLNKELGSLRELQVSAGLVLQAAPAEPLPGPPGP